MALYTTELAAEAMRDKARAEIERAKQTAAIEQERQRAEFRAATAQDSHDSTIRAGVLESLSRDELYNHAKQRGVKGRSRMTKKQLIEAVRSAW